LLVVSTMAVSAPTGEPPAKAAPAAPASTDYRVGPGDVLQVVVIGNDDLSRTAVVQSDGTIRLPLVGEVHVAALTVAESQRKLHALLLRDFLVNPQVEVTVKEYNSQFVTVVGEVNAAGRKPLRGQTRLVDVLVEAGGFTPRASGEILISRQDGAIAGEAKTLRLRLGSGEMTPQDQVNLEIALRNGDVVTATPKQHVAVDGEVVRPGRLAIDGEMTLSVAISLAGGLTRFGSSDVQIRRADPETGKARILKADLKAIRKGKIEDPILQPNDVVSVPRKLF
jgi:polysaccharide export outer membrane protein